MKKNLSFIGAGLLILMISGCNFLPGNGDNPLVPDTPSNGNSNSEITAGDISITTEENYDFSYHYGDTCSLKVNASIPEGSGTLSYQWYKGSEDNNTIIPGATKSIYTFTAGNAESINTYFCVVTCINGNSIKTNTTYLYTVQISNIIIYDGDYITEATTWSAVYTYYIKSWLSVEENATLIIPAGTIIKFNNEAYLETISGGAIKATGTAENPIIFTSCKDNTTGITIPGTIASTPLAGDWDGITCSSQGSTFEYCNFEYMNEGLSLSSKTTIKNSIFTKNENTALIIDNDSSINKSVITNNTFYNNTCPVSCPVNYTLDTSNTFHKDIIDENNNIVETLINTKQYIEMPSSDFITNQTVYGITEIPYYFSGNWIEVSENGLLKIEDNVILKMSQDSYITYLYNDGATITLEDCIITSFRDDSHGGDSNRDSTSTTPDSGDWNGISISSDNDETVTNIKNQWKNKLLYVPEDYFSTEN